MQVGHVLTETTMCHFNVYSETWDILGLLFVQEVGLDDYLKSLPIWVFLWFCEWSFVWHIVKHFPVTMKNIGTLDKKYTEFQQIWFIFCLFSMIRYRNQRMCCRERICPELKIRRMSQGCGHCLGNFGLCCAMIFITHYTWFKAYIDNCHSLNFCLWWNLSCEWSKTAISPESITLLR